jgi:RNA polymerase sigma factor (sigma-70 family)
MSVLRRAGSSVNQGTGVTSWGGDAAFDSLVEARRAELLRVALFITGNLADAEDVVQDAVLSLAAVWDTVRPGAGYAYLRTAVVRKSLDGFRRAIPAELLDQPVEELGFLRFDDDRHFFARLRQLPAQQRAVLALRFYNGLDTRTIARLLEIGPSAVRSHLARGLATLRTTTRGHAL